MADSTDQPSSGSEFAHMTKLQKLAALLVLLGSESAAQILKGLDEHEIESITQEMAKFVMLSQELQGQILQEFTSVAIEASTAIRGGPEFTQHTLEKALGLFKASDLINRVAPTRAPVAAMQQIADLEPRQVANLVRYEQPQTIALILSYLSAEKASQVLPMLPAELREAVVERLATLAPTPVEVVEKVLDVLNQRLGRKHTRALRQTGGLKSAAELLNALDRNLSKTLLTAIEQRNAALGQAIRQKMFTFEDVAQLDLSSLQKVLREVDTRDLAVALKNASETVKKALLGAISKRAAETVNEEMTFTGPLKAREIEAAQNRIIEVIRRLESEGEIELGESAEKEEVHA